MRKFWSSTVLLIAAAAGILLIGSGVLEIKVSGRDRVAGAIDLFGRTSPEAARRRRSRSGGKAAAGTASRRPAARPAASPTWRSTSRRRW